MTASPTHQAKTALNGIFTPGVSRDDLKSRGIADQRITSISTMRSYVKSASRFARWCKANHSVRLIGNITPEMAREYIQSLRDRELSGGYIGRIIAAIRKLDTAMKTQGWRAADAPDLLEPGAGGGWHSDHRPERSYTADQAEAITADLDEHARDPQVADVIRLQCAAGLRIAEAVMIRGEDIDVETNTVNVERGTKGGRPRGIDIDPKHSTLLARLKRCADGHRDGHVFRGRGSRGKSLAGRAQGAVRHACERLDIPCYGTHGFRKLWAQERYRRLRAEGLSEREVRRAVADQLGHGRLAVLKSYIPDW